MEIRSASETIDQFQCLIHLVVHQLNNYLQLNIILSNCQFGFLSGLSIENGIQYFLNDIYIYIYTVFSRSEYAICIFVDLRKAFDTVNITGKKFAAMIFVAVHINGSITIFITNFRLYLCL